jgi:hypothetical protein
VDKNRNLENGVTLQVDEFNLIVIKESTMEIVGREAKSELNEGREHQNLSSIGCRDIFPSGRTPLQDVQSGRK